MDWSARSPYLNPIEHVWDFLGRRLAARTLPPVTIQELRLALQEEWAAMPHQLIDTLILSMGRRCETCLAVRGDHPLLKTGCFLLDTHHRDVSAFSRIALHATFSIKLLFITSDFSLISVAYVLHMSLRIGDLTVLNVLIWKAFVQSYIEKTASSLIFAHQCIIPLVPTDHHLVWSDVMLEGIVIQPYRVIFSDESIFNLGTVDYHVHVWRPCRERLNPVFAVKGHSTPPTGVMV
ncbi:DDE_3 domain-containing protein [Trichonephila clavipes]|nr:DDE_3 domain-containing protein [Trichonephila clavipes]